MDENDMSDAVDRVQANAAYSYRVPSPHRVYIPPPIWGDDGESPITVGKIIPQPGLDLSFLDGIDCDRLFDRDRMLSNVWSYDQRRSATEMLPYLYLGPMMAARDRDTLRRDGITMILAVAHRSSFPSRMAVGPMKAADELGLDKLLIEVADNSELIAAFPRAIQAINQHLADVHARGAPPPQLCQPPSGEAAAHDGQHTTGRVLVFCESGNERSAAVVAAYFMQMFKDVDHIKACQMVNLRRFSTNFDDGLKQYLLSYHSIVKAQRDVAAMAAPSLDTAQAAATAALGATAHPKRSFDVVGGGDEDDVDVEMEDDIERFSGRSFTPFRDQGAAEGGSDPAPRR